MVGIYGKPDIIPPKTEVREGRYEYQECPLAVQPPMDHRNFLHYMSSCNPKDHQGLHTTLRKDSTFLRRLPKKVGSDIFSDLTPDLPFGWGVHILEGPNKEAISCIAFAGLLLSFVVSLTYAILAKTQEQGFGIGQWMVAILSAGLTTLYF